jgi:hypothetical protein
LRDEELEPGFDAPERPPERRTRRLAFQEVGRERVGELLVLRGADLAPVLDLQELQDRRAIIKDPLLVHRQGGRVHRRHRGHGVPHHLQEEVPHLVVKRAEVGGREQVHADLAIRADADTTPLALEELMRLAGRVDVGQEIVYRRGERPTDDRSSQPSREGSVGPGIDTSGPLVFDHKLVIDFPPVLRLPHANPDQILLLADL